MGGDAPPLSLEVHVGRGGGLGVARSLGWGGGLSWERKVYERRRRRCTSLTHSRLSGCQVPEATSKLLVYEALSY
jgi:hypothetical protein